MANSRSKDANAILALSGRPLMEEVHEGLSARRKLLLRAPGLRVDAFVFHPYFLSHLEGHLRLFGYLAGRGQLADFPVGMLTEARCLPETFEDELATEPKIRHGRGWIPSGTRHSVCLRFRASAGWQTRLRICAGQSIEASHEHILVRFSTDDLGEVRRFASALGSSVTVEEPGVLRSRLRRYLDGACPIYSPQPQDLKRAPSS